MAHTESIDFDLAHTYCGIAFEKMLSRRTTILSYLTYHAHEHGDDPFITAVTAEGHATTLSYSKLDVLSQRLGSWLRRELHVRSRTIFALLPANDITSVVTIFGLLRSGAAILLLNPSDPVERLRQQTDAIHVEAVLYVPCLSTKPFPSAIMVPDLSMLDKESIIDSDPLIESSADALFFGTSGSTAASKLVVQCHYNAVMNADAVCRHHGLQRGDRLLGCLPIYHVNGLHFTLFATLVAGAHIMLAHAFDPFNYPRLLDQFRPRIASVVPSILEALLGTWRQPVFPKEFNYFVSAAAPLTARTVRDVDQKWHVRVLQGYGLTETTNFSTTLPRDLSQETYRRFMLDADIPSIGTALYGNEVAVLSPSGDRVAPGEVGEICMRGHNMMLRYAGNNSVTASAFRNGWFHSQDLGFEIVDSESGRIFFVITGRIKNLAKVRGETVSLDEMDRVLQMLPGVQDAACVSLPHRLFGDEIIAAVVCPQEVHDTDLRAHLRTIFSSTALPRRIVRLEVIPRTTTGKILRAELAQKLALIDK